MDWWEQPGNRGDFLGHWAHGPFEFPSVLAGLGWSLRTKKAQGSLHWRFFMARTLLHESKSCLISQCSLCALGETDSHLHQSDKNHLFGLCLRRCKAAPMAKIYFHIGGAPLIGIFTYEFPLNGESPPLPDKMTPGSGHRIQS